MERSRYERRYCETWSLEGGIEKRMSLREKSEGTGWRESFQIMEGGSSSEEVGTRKLKKM